MPIDKNRGRSFAFKALSRSEYNKIYGGSRPKYEKDFHNDMCRYNVKHLDKKIHGQAKFDPPKSELKPSPPRRAD